MKGQIEKRGDGVYRIRWYIGRVDGKRKYGSKTVRGTKRQAQQSLRAILERLDRGLAMPSRVPTLAEFVETWKEGEAAARLRPRTLRQYGEVLSRHVLPALGSTQLRALHTAGIEEAVVKPLRTAEKIRTAQLAVAVLSKVMASAVKDPTLGLVGNPCRGVEVGGVRRREVQPLNEGERDRFREAIQSTKHEALFLVLMGTGMRPGEALALDWGHMDLDEGAVRIERAVDDRGEFHAPKTAKGRRVEPLGPELRQVLRELHLRRGRPNSGLVFPDELGGVLDARNLLRRHFRPALKRAEIPESRVQQLRLYDLRHGFATAALEAGADVRTTADLMGHANTRMTMEVYQHISDQRRREAAEGISDRLLGRRVSRTKT
jgi:integrase